MKIKKVFKVLAFSLCLGTMSNAMASDLNENTIISDTNKAYELKSLTNFDKASAREIKAFIKQKNKKNYSLSFGKEYEDRLKLAENIELLKKADDSSNEKIIDESIDVLNADNIDNIKTQTDKLSKIISLYSIENKDLSLSDEDKKEIEDQLLTYLDKGLLFESKNKKENLDLLEKAILNSKSYELSDEKTKDKYGEVIYNVKNNNFDESDAYKILTDFINSDDKLKFDEYLIKTYEIGQNQKFNSSNDTSISAISDNEVVETTTIDGQNNKSESNANESSSAFVKNEKTKDKYENLTTDQKKELDLIDTDKNGQMSDSELESSENFTPNLDKSSWLYPFTEKALNEENDDNKSSSQTSEKSQSDKNLESIETPKTVTIDNKTSKSPELSDQADDKDPEDESKDFKESEAQPEEKNIDAASIVKTGVKSLGLVVVILAIAIISYCVLRKNKENIRN